MDSPYFNFKEIKKFYVRALLIESYKRKKPLIIDKTVKFSARLLLKIKISEARIEEL